MLAVTSRRADTGQISRSMIAINERKEFEQLLKQEDDNSIVMEGMPMFLVSASWYENWL